MPSRIVLISNYCAIFNMKRLTEEDAIGHQRRVNLWKDKTSGTINFKRLNIEMARNYLQGCPFQKQSLGIKEGLKKDPSEG